MNHGILNRTALIQLLKVWLVGDLQCSVMYTVYRRTSTTSRLYIGLAVCLYVFINISLFSLMFKPLYLCRERPDQESD